MLVSELIVDRLLSLCDLNSSSRVLEIGTGLGFVTKRLAEKSSFVETFEIDPRLFSRAKESLSGFKNVRFVCSDVFEHDINGESFDFCVASLPYSESQRFTKWLAKNAATFQQAAVLIQSEFAEKMVSKPGMGSYRAVSVISQISFKVEKMFKVSRDCFSPPPKVGSVAVRISPNLKLNQPFFNEKRIKIIDFLFSFRGRLLSSALKKLVPESTIIPVSKEDLLTRVESLPPMEYSRIIQLLERYLP